MNIRSPTHLVNEKHKNNKRSFTQIMYSKAKQLFQISQILLLHKN